MPHCEPSNRHQPGDDGHVDNSQTAAGDSQGQLPPSALPSSRKKKTGKFADWCCAVCGNVNYSHRDRCHMMVCKAPRGFPGPYCDGPPLGVMSTKRPLKHQTPWKCPLCDKDNRATRDRCQHGQCPVMRVVEPNGTVNFTMVNLDVKAEEEQLKVRGGLSGALVDLELPSEYMGSGQSLFQVIDVTLGASHGSLPAQQSSRAKPMGSFSNSSLGTPPAAHAALPWAGAGSSSIVDEAEQDATFPGRSTASVHSEPTSTSLRPKPIDVDDLTLSSAAANTRPTPATPPPAYTSLYPPSPGHHPQARRVYQMQQQQNASTSVAPPTQPASRPVVQQQPVALSHAPPHVVVSPPTAPADHSQQHQPYAGVSHQQPQHHQSQNNAGSLFEVCFVPHPANYSMSESMSSNSYGQMWSAGAGSVGAYTASTVSTTSQPRFFASSQVNTPHGQQPMRQLPNPQQHQVYFQQPGASGPPTSVLFNGTDVAHHVGPSSSSYGGPAAVHHIHNTNPLSMSLTQAHYSSSSTSSTVGPHHVVQGGSGGSSSNNPMNPSGDGFISQQSVVYVQYPLR